MMSHAALDRTLLLMRDDTREDAPDHLLLDALLGTRIALIADPPNLATHSAQSAFIAAAMGFARQGATVHLIAPNSALIGSQPPLQRPNLIDALTEIDGKIIPRTSFVSTAAMGFFDVAVVLGDTAWTGSAETAFRINADDWSGWLSEINSATRWKGTDWPFGGLAAAALAAGEGYKAAMRKLRYWRRNDVFDEYFGSTACARVELVPASTPHVGNLGTFDFISGGAITHATLFALARIPGVGGEIRIIEDDTNNMSNANRYALLRLDRLHLLKATDLATQGLGGLKVSPVTCRYEEMNLLQIGPLAPTVLVGVDHIPTRWEVQRASPSWLGIGATSHYSTMFTAHQGHLPCAKCAHPIDDVGVGQIPTVSFVSLWAGLFLAARYVRIVACGEENPDQQQIWFCPLRPEERPQLSPVPIHRKCICQHAVLGLPK
jgi:hypothetical protein